jgi:hypothetical protein
LEYSDTGQSLSEDIRLVRDLIAVMTAGRADARCCKHLREAWPNPQEQKALATLRAEEFLRTRCYNCPPRGRRSRPAYLAPTATDYAEFYTVYQQSVELST